MKACTLFAETKKNKREQKKDRKLMTKPVHKDRSVDEIKNRYYEVAKAILLLLG